MTPSKQAVTAHIRHFEERHSDIWTLVLTADQMREWTIVIARSLDENMPHPDGTFHLAVRYRPFKSCRSSIPACGGGEGSVSLVRPKQRRR